MVVSNMPKVEEKKEKRKKLLIVAQEIAFAKTLASNEKRLRDRALKKLRRWLANRSETSNFTKQDMLTLWKGLFYCMWMSDKPLVQEELAESISSLIHNLHKEVAPLFVEGFFLTLREDWASIDNFRIPKFQMLVRRMLRQALISAALSNWEQAPALADKLWSSVLCAGIERPPPLGLGMHVCEIFLEEVAKVSGRAPISQAALTALLEPFVRCLASSEADARLRTTVASAVFSGLIAQSDEGMEHQEKIAAWRQMGCPAIPLSQLERMDQPESEDEEKEEEEMGEEGEKDLDPRAGQLDVELPQIPFDPKQVAELLRQFVPKPGVNSKAKRRLRHMAEKFDQLAGGDYPLAFELPMGEDDEETLRWRTHGATRSAAVSLSRLEEQLQREEAAMGLAKPAVLKRLAKQMAEEEEDGEQAPSRPKKRRRRGGSKKRAKWQVTAVEEEAQNGTCSPETAISPRSAGQWEVSPISGTSKNLCGDLSGKPQQLATLWDVPLRDGEYEYFVAPRKKKSPAAKKAGKKAAGNPMFQQNGSEACSPETPQAHKKLRPREGCSQTASVPTTPEARGDTPCTPVSIRMLSERLNLSLTASGKKKLNFDLTKNKFQEVREYAEQLRNSPGIPHDPNKRPTQGLLKSGTPNRATDGVITPLTGSPATRRRAAYFS